MPGTVVPLRVIRGQQGDRTYFVTSISNAVYLDMFTPKMDPEDPEDEKAQRNLDPRRPKIIGEYVLKNSTDYVLPTVVYALEDRYEFVPDDEGSNTGMLVIPPGTNLRCLDGQHRRAGLTYAAAQNPDLMTETSSILIYIESDINRRRQMFSDMNSTTVKVGKAINISFDSRDPFARAAVYLAREDRNFAGRFQDHTGRVVPNSDLWYALSALYFSLQHLSVGSSGRIGNYDQYKEENLVNRGTQFLEMLWNSRPEYKSVASGEKSAEQMRKESILFWGVGLRALASGIFVTQDKTDRYPNLSEFGEAIGQIDFTPQNPRWAEIGFVQPGRTTPIDRFKPRRDAADEIAELIKKAM